MIENRTTIGANHGADTRDIIFHLCQAVPPAIKSIKLPKWKNAGKNGALIDAYHVARWINENIKYKRDGYINQNIQLPNRLMYKSKEGDCKSFSLLFLSIMTKLGYKAGFRFASYRVNKIPTHVYNFIIDEKGNKHTFDSCLKTLKESNKATYIKDMQVNYLSGVPVMTEDDSEIGALFKLKGRPIKKLVNKGIKTAKVIGLSLPRQAFRALIALNFRGFATKISNANQKKIENFWKSVGGNFGDLKSAINTGKNKKPLFGSKKTTKKKGIGEIEGEAIYLDEMNEPFIGAVDVVALIGSSAPIIAALVKLLKKEGVKVEETELPPFTPLDEGSGFKVNDPDPGVKVEDTGSAGFTSDKSSATGGISPMILIGGAVALAGLLYFTTKKKR